MKYAVKLKIAENDWLYVVDPEDNSMPQLYNSREDAEYHADIWRVPGNEDSVKVVEYAS